MFISKRMKLKVSQVPLKRPSHSDHALWVTALKRKSSEYKLLPFSLGGFVKCLHKAYKWTTSYGGTRAHFEMVLNGVQQYIVYTLTSETNTRSERRFFRSDNIASLPLPFYASVSQLSGDQIQLHSWVKEYQVPNECKSLFWETILLGNNRSLWRHLCCNDDGTRIWQGLCSGTLLIIHNGSYMREVSPNICSTVVIIRCTNTGKTCKCTIAK
jgi:hypothetical protein